MAVALGSVLVAGITVIAASAAEATSASGKAALIGLLGVALGLVALAAFRARFSPLSPYAIYVYSHAALFIMRPAYNALSQNGLNVFDLSESGPPMVAAGLLGALGFVCVSLGYALVARARTADAPDRRASERGWLRLEASRERAIIVLSVLFFFVGLVLYSRYISRVGGLSSFLSLNSGRSAELTEALASSSGYEISGLLMTTGTSLLLLMLGLARRRKGLVALAAILLLVAELPQLMTGSRSMFVPLVVAILIIVTTTRPRLITLPRALLTGVPAFVLLFVAPRILRSEVSETNTAFDAIRESFSYEGIMGGFFGSFDTAMIDAFSLQIEAQSTGRLDLAGGATYLGALGSVIPRDLWPSKPLAVDTVLNQALFPETAARNIGFSFGVYSEPFFNWGVVGVILVAVLFGIVLGHAEAALRNSRSMLTIVAVAMFSGQVFTLVRGSLSFDLQRLLIPLLPLLAVWVVSALFVRERAIPPQHIDSARAQKELP